MAELLIKAVEPIPFREGAYRKGDIVEVRADGGVFGQKEGLPLFIRVKVPGLLIRDLKQYVDKWDVDIKFDVVASDPSIDGFRLRLFNANTNASGQGNTERAKVEAFIEKWNGTVVSVAPNEVRFDITVMDAFQSEGYWDVDTSGVVFTEVFYDQATGIHTVDIDYNAIGNNPSYIENFLDAKVLSVVEHANKVIRVTVDRGMVRQEFMDDINREAEGRVERRRWYIDPAQVSTIVAAGGETTVTVGQLAANLKDRWTE